MQSKHNLLSSLGLFLAVVYSGLGLTCHASVHQSVKQVFKMHHSEVVGLFRVGEHSATLRKGCCVN